MVLRLAMIAAAAAILSTARRAAASESTAVRIAYSAPADCPDERTFVDRLHERAAHVRTASVDESARTFVVTIRSTAHGASATFAVTDPDGTRTDERLYESTTCNDVVNVVALAAALTIDEEQDAPPVELDTEPSPPMAPPVERPVLALRARQPVAPPRWRGALTTAAAAEVGVAPRVVAALRVSGELRAPWRGHPAIRVGLTRSASAGAVVEDARASFTWTSGLVDVCPYAFEGGMASVSPCARIEVGALDARGERVEPARSETRLWFGAGAVGRLRFAPWRMVFFEIEAGARAHILRDSFRVRADELVFRAPPLGWNAGAGVGLLFP
jgi:hypothetical protein